MPGVPGVGFDSPISLSCGIPPICGCSHQGFGSQLCFFPSYTFWCGLLSTVKSGESVLPVFKLLSGLVALMWLLSQCVQGTRWAQGPPTLLYSLGVLSCFWSWSIWGPSCFSWLVLFLCFKSFFIHDSLTFIDKPCKADPLIYLGSFLPSFWSTFWYL